MNDVWCDTNDLSLTIVSNFEGEMLIVIRDLRSSFLPLHGFEKHDMTY